MKKERVEELFKKMQYEWGIEDYELTFFEDKHKKLWFGANSGVLAYCHVLSKTIGMWKPYIRVNDEAYVKETLLHEIAHALADQTDVSEDDHGELWRDMCKLVGAIPDPISCFHDRIEPVSVFGWYGLSRWLSIFFERGCTCFKCTWGVDRY